MFKSLFLFALIGLTFAGELDFDECDDLNPPTSIEVDGCDSAPCDVKIGNSYNFAFKFTSPISADKLSLDIVAKVLGLWIPWPGAPSQICGQGIECPLVAGQDYKYTSTMTIPSIAPPISTTVQFKLVNSETKEAVFCSRFGVRVNLFN